MRCSGSTRNPYVWIAVAIAIAAAIYATTSSASVGHSPAPSGRRGGGYPQDCRAHGLHHHRIWQPVPTTQPWQWQLQGKIDTEVSACVYDVDGFETSRRTVAALHRRHVKVICYLDEAAGRASARTETSSRAR